MLTPEEEQELRSKIKKELELKNIQVHEDQLKRKEQYNITIEREKMIQDIILEEEEKFYKSKGYLKYTSHTGHIYWLTPEEFEARSHRKKTKRKRKPQKSEEKSTKLVVDWKYLLAMIIILSGGLTIIFFLIKFIAKIV
ncbi:MAG: hypothetical protein PHV06_01975 [bacterium]|nr:hypothetical protein [bacterium]